MAERRLFQRSRERIRFRNDDLDFYFQWTLGHQTGGGAELAECFRAAALIDERDPDSWVRAWTDAAQRVDAVASVALDRGHTVSAREASLRASNYYRSATIALRPRDPRFTGIRANDQRAFQRAARLLDPPVDVLNVPFGSATLPGYIRRAPNGDGRTLIMVGGGETSAEELYGWAATGGVERGYHVIFVDLPGQGDTPASGLHLRPDSEVPFASIVDHAVTLPGVDPERLVAYGISGGGYLLCRALAFEPRIRAAVANAPIVDMYRRLATEIPPLLRSGGLLTRALMRLASRRNPFLAIAIERFCWQAGVSSWEEAMEIAKHANLDGLVERISCPVLTLIGAAESSEALAQARQFHNELRSAPKEFRILTADEGADTHCQVNNLSLMQAIVFDWLDEVLA